MPDDARADTSSGHLYAVLETEKVNPATVTIDRMSPLEMGRVMNAEDARVALAVEQELPHIARAIEEIAARLRRGGRLICFGPGTSGRLGALDASEFPPTFNLPPEQVMVYIVGGRLAQVHAGQHAEKS